MSLRRYNRYNLQCNRCGVYACPTNQPTIDHVVSKARVSDWWVREDGEYEAYCSECRGPMGHGIIR